MFEKASQDQVLQRPDVPSGLRAIHQDRCKSNQAILFLASTNAVILQQSLKLGKGGSTALTGILIDGQKLVVANVGGSRATQRLKIQSVFENPMPPIVTTGNFDALHTSLSPSSPMGKNSESLLRYRKSISKLNNSFRFIDSNSKEDSLTLTSTMSMSNHISSPPRLTILASQYLNSLASTTDEHLPNFKSEKNTLELAIERDE
ncbi:hypothetical protein Bca101_057893 [Brassica carinata]